MGHQDRVRLSGCSSPLSSLASFDVDKTSPLQRTSRPTLPLHPPLFFPLFPKNNIILRRLVTFPSRSSVYTVAFQTQLLNLVPGEKVLEIGTGSGYQTAVLTQCDVEVYSVERHRSLYKTAKTLLSQLNYRANLFHGDGYLGLSQIAPFDKILVTCGAVEVPPLLLEQLKLGGEMVIPIGFKNQIMTVFSKDLDGNIKKKEYHNFQFVPMLRDKE